MIRCHPLFLTGPVRGRLRFCAPRQRGSGSTGNLLEKREAAGGVGSSLGQVGGAQRGRGHDQKGENSPGDENIFFGVEGGDLIQFQ